MTIPQPTPQYGHTLRTLLLAIYIFPEAKKSALSSSVMKTGSTRRLCREGRQPASIAFAVGHCKGQASVLDIA